MRPLRSWISVAITGLIVATTVAATPASAAARTPERALSLYAPTALVLTLAHGEEAQPVRRAAVLRCEPTGGTHPAAPQACGTLAAAQGDLASIPRADGFCTKEYAPVTVTIRGVWRGSLVNAQATYSNRCMMLQATGSVYAF